MHSVWDSLLHISSIVVACYILIVSVYFAPQILQVQAQPWPHSSPCMTHLDRFRLAVLRHPDLFAILVGATVCAPVSALGALPMIYNSWAWYPFAWVGNYRIYRTHESIKAALSTDLCVDQLMRDVHLPRRSWFGGAGAVVHGLSSSIFGSSIDEETRHHMPLCLDEPSWDVLSSGALSSYEKNDVRGVMQGLEFLRQEGNGVTIAVLARDTKESLDAFIENIDSLSPFIPKLAVVIFENDSSDGTRDAIRTWSDMAALSDRGYHVDLMECEEAVDCKFGKKHRDSDTGDYTKTKAIKDMDVFRQRITDYITGSPLYEDYSHMLVLDMDLGVSISPFGLLHSLGKHPDSAVASSGRQLYPMSFGSLDTPYDFSAFRPVATQANSWLLGMHEQWCQIMPAGDRWRNSCDAPSPFLFSEMIRADRGEPTGIYDDPDYYRVQSAFNGAVLYPLDLVRETQATYDAGEDGQRCEHIGFNLAVQDEKHPMYVNRRWDMHIDPAKMAGPTGWRAKNAVVNVTSNSKIFLYMAVCQIFSYWCFINSITMLGIYLVYPLLAPLVSGSKNIRRLLFSHQRKQLKMKTDRRAIEETLLKLV